MLVSPQPRGSLSTSGKVCRMYMKKLLPGRVCVLSPQSLQATSFPIVVTRVFNPNLLVILLALTTVTPTKLGTELLDPPPGTPQRCSASPPISRGHSSSLGPDRHSNLLIDGPTHSNQPPLLLTLPFSDTVLPTQRAVIKEGTLPLASPTPH